MTAGIAHEIQNPLNFVNNFAESSAELLEELRQAGSKEEQEELLSDLQIVPRKDRPPRKARRRHCKDMSEHSRGGDPVKSMVQLNKLAEEYLHLAYHGMRARIPVSTVGWRNNSTPRFRKFRPCHRRSGGYC